jgi:hypothetical protein
VRKVICVAIVLATVPAAITAYRAFDGHGALSVGPVRPTYRCEPVCDHAMLAPPSLPTDRPALETPPMPIPEPGTLLIFGTAVLVLGAMARWL